MWSRTASVACRSGVASRRSWPSSRPPRTAASRATASWSGSASARSRPRAPIATSPERIAACQWPKAAARSSRASASTSASWLTNDPSGQPPRHSRGPVQVEKSVAPRGERLDGVQRAQRRALTLEDPPGLMPDRRSDQGGLVREVVVELGAAHPGGTPDILGTGGRHAILVHQPRRGAEDPLPSGPPAGGEAMLPGAGLPRARLPGRGTRSRRSHPRTLRRGNGGPEEPRNRPDRTHAGQALIRDAMNPVNARCVRRPATAGEPARVECRAGITGSTRRRSP